MRPWGSSTKYKQYRTKKYHGEERSALKKNAFRSKKPFNTKCVENEKTNMKLHRSKKKNRNWQWKKNDMHNASHQEKRRRWAESERKVRRATPTPVASRTLTTGLHVRASAQPIAPSSPMLPPAIMVGKEYAIAGIRKKFAAQGEGT